MIWTIKDSANMIQTIENDTGHNNGQKAATAESVFVCLICIRLFLLYFEITFLCLLNS